MRLGELQNKYFKVSAGGTRLLQLEVPVHTTFLPEAYPVETPRGYSLMSEGDDGQGSSVRLHCTFYGIDRACQWHVCRSMPIF